MPGTNNNNIPIHPGCYPMGVPLVIHVCQPLEAHSLFIKYTGLLQISFGVCDCTACHINFTSHLYTLLIPKREKVSVPYFNLVFH